jgi:hypothetical protein
MITPLSWHCEEIYNTEVPPALTGQDCVVTAYATTTEATTTLPTGTYTGPNFQEWLLVGGVIIFFLSFMVWGRIFSPVKHLYGN